MSETTCPICGTPVDGTTCQTMPFCSDRCRLVDLRRWLGEQYMVPVLRDPELDGFFQDEN